MVPWDPLKGRSPVYTDSTVTWLLARGLSPNTTGFECVASRKTHRGGVAPALWSEEGSQVRPLCGNGHSDPYARLPQTLHGGAPFCVLTLSLVKRGDTRTVAVY